VTSIASAFAQATVELLSWLDEKARSLHLRSQQRSQPDG
jgi:hypothetical protein